MGTQVKETPIKVRKTGKVLEIVEGGEDLEEGKVVQVYTVADLRRVLRGMEESEAVSERGEEDPSATFEG
jgi:hypothetical protein